MKRVLLVCIIGCVFFNSCKNNKKQSTLELIDLAEWNAITISTIKEKMQWDTLRYVGDDIPPLVIDDIVINSFEEEIRQRILNLREKEIAVMQKQLLLSHERDVYIHEFQGFNHAGHYKYFMVMFDEEDSNYLFTYNADAHSFAMEQINYSTDHYKEPIFYFDIEYGILRHIEITTKITRDKTSQLSYEIIGVVITSD